uniref:Uncharacterized protein n=1 Tax=Romanomermis culicivorax TaxID=13658 RepID=A0A915KK92_ROMCU
MQIDELDDQWRRHLHRDGAPQRDKNNNSTNRPERMAKGPGTPLADSKRRNTFPGILQNHSDVRIHI